jgi:hypothetical protein
MSKAAFSKYLPNSPATRRPPVKRARPLAVESLESRDVPAVFGLPWADSGNLTLSFIPDGTPTPNGPSTLFKTMNSIAPASEWKQEILRAVQTWAQQVNVDVGVVADDGSPLGTTGAVQGDRRFGDIRIAAVPLAESTELASASPFSWTGTTFSGDIVFDANRRFSIGASAFDLFSVTLHEAGHVFGIDHADDADTAMNAKYRFATGLGTGDIAEVQSLYGARAADSFDAARSNNTAATASVIPQDSLLPGRSTAKADLGVNDTDYFKFTVPLLAGLTGVSVRTTTEGWSLFTPKVTVYNGAGRVVASGLAADPLNNDLALRFPSTLLGGVYTVKVEAANPDFAVGGYQLTVDFLSLGTLLLPVTNLLAPVLDRNSNDTLGFATLLSPIAKSTPDSRFDYGFRGVIENRRDVDNYRIRSTNADDGGNLNVVVWGLQVDALDPAVHVFDAKGRPLGFEVLANDRGVFSLQITGVVGGQDYYLQIVARDGTDTGSYYLGADFNSLTPTAFDPLSGDTLDGTTRTDTLVVDQAALFDFAVAAAGAGAGVKLSVLDASGKDLLTVTAGSNGPAVTKIVHLKQGTYTIRYSAIGAAPVQYFSQMLTLNDPVGPYSSTTTSTSPQSSGTTTSGSGTSSGSTTTTTTTKPSSSTGYTYTSSSSTSTMGGWYSY